MNLVQVQKNRKREKKKRKNWHHGLEAHKAIGGSVSRIRVRFDIESYESLMGQIDFFSTIVMCVYINIFI